MKIARDVSKENLKSCIGKKYKVLIENTTFDNKFYVGRSYMDIPDTDGMVIIKNIHKRLDKYKNLCYNIFIWIQNLRLIKR